VPFFAASLAVSVVTIFVHHARSMVNTIVRTDGFAGRLATSAWCVWFYLYKLLWPAHLAFLYPRWEVNPRRLLHWLPLVALVGVLLGLFLLRRRIGRGALIALLAYVALLFPVLGFVDVYFMRYSFVADHWQYHAGFVVIAAVVAAATHALRRLSGKTNRRPAVVAGSLLASGVCIVLAVESWHEAHHYQNGMTVWAEAIRDNPTNGILHSNYGAELLAAGRKDEARRYFLRAIELDPTPSEPYLGMGASYMPGDPATALEWYQRAVGKEGTAGHPRGFVGEALLALGRTDEAMASFELALADHPVNPRYRGTVARLEMERGNPGRAAELYRDEIHDWPRYPENWYNLADALAAAGKTDEARKALAEACRRAKGNHGLINGFGSQFLVGGRPELAEQALREAIRLQPDYGPAHANLGRALEALNRPVEAEAEYAEALRVQPGFRDAAQALARLQQTRSSTRPATTKPASAFSGPPGTMPAR
jgi:tetratricopeptide (TPR) repeat protein